MVADRRLGGEGEKAGSGGVGYGGWGSGGESASKGTSGAGER